MSFLHCCHLRLLLAKASNLLRRRLRDKYSNRCRRAIAAQGLERAHRHTLIELPPQVGALLDVWIQEGSEVRPVPGVIALLPPSWSRARVSSTYLLKF
jgi:hypothetical protein